MAQLIFAEQDYARIEESLAEIDRLADSKLSHLRLLAKHHWDGDKAIPSHVVDEMVEWAKREAKRIAKSELVTMLWQRAVAEALVTAFPGSTPGEKAVFEELQGSTQHLEILNFERDADEERLYHFFEHVLAWTPTEEAQRQTIEEDAYRSAGIRSRREVLVSGEGRSDGDRKKANDAHLLALRAMEEAGLGARLPELEKAYWALARDAVSHFEGNGRLALSDA